MRSIFVFSILGLVSTSLAGCSDKSSNTEPQEAVEVQTEDTLPLVLVLESQETALENTVELRGTTKPDRFVEVKAETDGVILNTPIKQGTYVEAGTLLCRLDEDVRQAELAEARAVLEEAESNASGSTKLLQKGFVSKTRAVEDQAQLKSARAQLEQVELDIQRTLIKAPFDGRLETDTAEQGTLLQRGGVCATLIDFDPIRVELFLSETEISSIVMGAPVDVSVPTGQTFRATVSFIGKVADETTRTFRVEATADNPNGEILAGITAIAHVSLSDTRAHFIPQSALVLNDEGVLGVRIVQQNNNKALFKPVKLLKDNNKGVWVQGLAATEHIIIQGQNYVNDGREVATRVTSMDDLP